MHFRNKKSIEAVESIEVAMERDAPGSRFKLKIEIRAVDSGAEIVKEKEK